MTSRAHQAASPHGRGSVRAGVALAGALLLAGCAVAPRPTRTAIVTPPPPPATAVVPPAVADWRDVPLTPGTWRYRPAAAAAGSSAGYGPPDAPVVEIRCDLAARQVAITRLPAAPGPLTLRTSSASRTVAADASGSVTFAARDPFLDELSFSRGRFSIAVPGAATLYVPAWAEPARVIEDCRG